MTTSKRLWHLSRRKAQILQRERFFCEANFSEREKSFLFFTVVRVVSGIVRNIAYSLITFLINPRGCVFCKTKHYHIEFFEYLIIGITQKKDLLLAVRCPVHSNYVFAPWKMLVNIKSSSSNQIRSQIEFNDFQIGFSVSSSRSWESLPLVNIVMSNQWDNINSWRINLFVQNEITVVFKFLRIPPKSGVTIEFFLCNVRWNSCVNSILFDVYIA